MKLALFFPVILAVIFQQFHSPVYSVTCQLSWQLLFPRAQCSYLLCGCRIHSKIAFKCLQVFFSPSFSSFFFFFFPSPVLLLSCGLTNLIAEHAGSGPVLRTAARRQGGMASPGYTYQHKLESQLGVISTLLGRVTCFQVLQDHPCSEQYARKACTSLENNILKTLCPAPDCVQSERGRRGRQEWGGCYYLPILFYLPSFQAQNLNDEMCSSILQLFSISICL